MWSREDANVFCALLLLLAGVALHRDTRQTVLSALTFGRLQPGARFNQGQGGSDSGDASALDSDEEMGAGEAGTGPGLLDPAVLAFHRTRTTYTPPPLLPLPKPLAPSVSKPQCCSHLGLQPRAGTRGHSPLQTVCLQSLADLADTRTERATSIAPHISSRL